MNDMHLASIVFTEFSDIELSNLYSAIGEEIELRRNRYIKEKIEAFKNMYQELKSMGVTVLYDSFDETYYLDYVDHFVFKEGNHIIDGGT